MTREYANQQTDGFVNHIERIAVVGGGGQVGKFIVDELLKAGKHQITVLTREGSTSKIPSGVTIKSVNYDDPSTLVDALQNQQALVITMATNAPNEQQTKLIEAAAAANVPWILPNEFGVDPTQSDMQRDVFIDQEKAKYRERIEQLGKSSWIGIVCNFWYEYSLGGSSVRYGFDFTNRTVTFYDDGTTRINTSTWPQTGRAVANLLSLKVLPNDVNDETPCLSDFKNKFVYISSFNISQKDMLESVMRVTGTTLHDWTINYQPVQERYKSGLDEFRNGNMLGFAQFLYARLFYPDDSGNYEMRKGLHNDLLGLPQEDLDEYTKIAVQMAQSND